MSNKEFNNEEEIYIKKNERKKEKRYRIPHCSRETNRVRHISQNKGKKTLELERTQKKVRPLHITPDE